jgi:glycosyltransferase involved in cell wall biosynthesis
MDEVSDISAEPFVSVVIPAYNAEKTLERAMASVLQEKSVPLELIVVDDGSTDSTPQLIDNAARADKRVRRISRPNGHVAAACNTGIRAAQGKYVAFLEADDEWLPGKLRQQLQTFDSCPQIGAVFTNFYNHDEVTNTTELLSEQQKDVLAAMPRKCITDHAVIIDGDLRPSLLKSNFILRSSIMIPRSLLLDLGGSDENLRGDDDWDLWFRMGGKVRFAYLDQPLALRHKRSDSMSRPSPAWYGALIKSKKKSLDFVARTSEFRGLVAPLRLHICRLHRSLILSHVMRWEWLHACKALVAGLEFGFDPLSFLLVGLGVLGPIPFTVRRIVLGRLKSSNSFPTT